MRSGYRDPFICYCFGSDSPPEPPPPQPGRMGHLDAAPDPSQAHRYIGSTTPADMSGRYGGELITGAMTTDQAVSKRKAMLGG